MSTTIPQAASSGAVEELDNSDYSPPAEISPRGDIEAKQLPIWLRNDILDWHTLRLFEKIDRAKKTRACHWPDKTKDGTKGDLSFDEKQAFPWRGAVDTESRIVDEVINEEVDLAIQTWFSGEKIVRPRDVMDDDGQRRSQAWRHVLDFELDQSESERVDALDFGPLFKVRAGFLRLGVVFSVRGGGSDVTLSGELSLDKLVDFRPDRRGEANGDSAPQARQSCRSRRLP